ncbi:MAG: thioredoxin family protein [Chitinophagaceae bacterium]|nr:thioredoxin family protein [Chitinophagaceae bacterium]
MKRIFITLLIAIVTGSPVLSQEQYEILPDASEGKLFKGVLSRELLEKDSSFYNKWYAVNFKAYSPNADAVAGLKKHSDSLNLIVFMGTWCEDSHFIIPKLFHLLDAAGYSKDKISVIGTDRNKKTLGYLSESMNVTLVPTIIVMKKGKEAGRVVEYGKYGMFDKELAEIVNSIGATSH